VSSSTGSRAVSMVVYARYPEDPRVRREAEALTRAGWSVTVLCLAGPGASSTETVAGVRVRRLPLRAVRGGRMRYAYQYLTFLGLAALALATGASRPRVVHVHSLPDFLVFSALPARLRGARVILDLHEAFPEIVAARFRLPPEATLVRLAVAAETLSSLVAHRVLTVNDFIRDLYVRRGIPADKIEVVYNASTPPGRRRRREDRLVYAGGINRERDLTTCLRAFARLRATRPLRFTVYGQADPRYLEELLALAKALGVSPDVEFPGHVPQARAQEALAGSAAGLVPFERNPLTELGVPNKVFEAALLGLPLVMADLPALRSLFTGCGQFYAPGDAEDLAVKIGRAIDGGPEIEAGIESAARVASDLSWDRMEARLLAVYEDRRPAPSAASPVARAGQ